MTQAVAEAAAAPHVEGGQRRMRVTANEGDSEDDGEASEALKQPPGGYRRGGAGPTGLNLGQKGL